MTAIETWYTTLAAELAKDDSQSERKDSDGNVLATTVEQRIAIGLLQARAQECRAICGELQITQAVQNPAVHRIFGWLAERSSKLEHLALDLVKQYPPVDKPAEVREARQLVTLQ